MSSFLGHTLAAAAIHGGGSSNGTDDRPPPIAWFFWLVILASFPDLDYALATLRASQHDGVRITHSIAFATALPALTAIALAGLGIRGRRLAFMTIQAVAAGLSHLCLDLMVGVTPQAPLWPLVDHTIVLPRGVLPSAGRPSLSNIYFYRNLAIEIGVLLPLFGILRLRRRKFRGRRIVLCMMAICAIGCALVATSLHRG